jgi:hypothetical protein
MVVFLLYLGGRMARYLYRHLVRSSGASLRDPRRYRYGFWRIAPTACAPHQGRHDYESSESLLQKATMPDGCLEAGAGFELERFAGQAKRFCFMFGVQKTPDRLPDPR